MVIAGVVQVLLNNFLFKFGAYYRFYALYLSYRGRLVRYILVVYGFVRDIRLDIIQLARLFALDFRIILFERR